MFEELKAAWITEMYKSYSAILVPSISKQLSLTGMMLDLDSLPTFPYPFKELFIRWLISINKDRLEKGLSVIVTRQIIFACPLWKVIKCPLKAIKLTKEGMFKGSIGSVSTKKTVGTVGTTGTIGSINK